MNIFTLILTLTVGTLLAIGTPAWSDDKEGKIGDLLKDAKVTIDQAIKTALENFPGKVIEAELEQKHDKTVWEVEVLTAEQVIKVVHVDAESGSVVATEEKAAGKK